MECVLVKNGVSLEIVTSWQLLNDEFGVPQDFFGVSSTPLLHGDMLIVQVGAPAGPGVAAFDKRDGRMLWGVEREWGPSYASPVPATIHGKTRVLVFAGGDSDPPTGGLLGIDPDKGTLLFRHPWRSRSYESVNASRPAPIGDKVFISASYQTGSALLRVTPEDEIEEVWKTDEVGVHFSNTIHRDGHLYAFDGRNEGDASLVCVEVETGRVVWRESPTWKEKVVRRGRETFATRGILRGSFLHAQGRFLCLGELGSLHWLDLFVDPPYALIDGEESRPGFLGFLAALPAGGAVRPGGLVCVEHRRGVRLDPPPGYEPDDRREWGQTAVTFFRTRGSA